MARVKYPDWLFVIDHARAIDTVFIMARIMTATTWAGLMNGKTWTS